MIDGVLVTKTNDRRSVTLSASQHNLNVCDVESKQIIYTINIHTTKLDLGGNNQNLVFVNAPELNGDVVYFDADRTNIGKLKEIPNLAGKVQHIYGQKNQNLKTSLYGFIGLILFLSLLFYFRSPIAAQFSQLIPFSLEKKLADQAFTNKRTPEQKKVDEQLAELAKILKFEKSDWDHQFIYHISSEALPNAYATIGGHIFVNKGLIISLEKPEDLLGVVAHEMIHVKQRHVVKSVVQALGVYTVLSLLVGDVTGIAAVLVDQGGPLLNLSYSRELEDEADVQGMKLLVKNGVDPTGLANSLQVINAYHKKLVSESRAADVLEKIQKIEILNSHPEIEKRIENLRQQSDVYKQSLTFKPLDFDYDAFKEAVKENF